MAVGFVSVETGMVRAPKQQKCTKTKRWGFISFQKGKVRAPKQQKYILSSMSQEVGLHSVQ